MSRRYCFTLDLKDDPALIAEYKRHHENVWPEITESLRSIGVENLSIYLFATRLFMIMDVNDEFSLDAKARADSTNPKVVEWETLMWKFQKSLPEAVAGQKWMLMEKIYDLSA